MAKMLYLQTATIIALLLNGVCVLGQSSFPENTVLHCYGDDATCTGTFTTETEDELFYNLCCFTTSSPFDAFSVSAVNPGYYSVAGGACQSCMDSNVGVIYNNARCSDSPTCQTTRSSFSSFLQGIFNPVHAEINPCCGYSDDTDYYSLDGGPCLPCSPPPPPTPTMTAQPSMTVQPNMTVQPSMTTELAPTMSMQPTPTTIPPTSGADPHFVCPLKNGEFLCFSVQGEPDFNFNLFSDTNIQVNAKFSLPHPDDESRSLMNSSTFIQDVGLTFKGKDNRTTTTQIKLSALDHSVNVSNNTINVGSKPITITIIKGSAQIKISSETSITESLDETAPIRIISDVGFAVKVTFVKRHLNMAITDTSGLSKKAHGIQGQFMGPDVKIDKHNGLIRIGTMAPFSVRKGEIWPYLHQPGQCWYATNAGSQGEGILEGTYTDYIVENLFDSNYKYNQF